MPCDPRTSRRLTAFLPRLALVLLVTVFASCSHDSQSGKHPARLKVAAVYQTPLEEPWNAVLNAALLQAAKDLDFDYLFSEKVEAADFGKVLRGYAELGCSLIVGDAFFAGEEILRVVALEYPEVQFAFGSEFSPQEPNVSVFDNRTHEAAWLSGVIAATTSKSRTIGVVAALPAAEVNRLVNAFRAGARAVDRDIKVKISWIGSWFDPPRAREAALAQIDAGADLIFAERAGVIEAARERKVIAIGNLDDQFALAPEAVITSCVWNPGPLVARLIQTVRTGSPQALDLGEFSLMARGGASLAPFHQFETTLPESLKTRIRDLETRIKAGSLKIPVDEYEPVTD